MAKTYILWSGNLSAIDEDDDDTVYPEDVTETPPTTTTPLYDYGIDHIWYEYDHDENGKLVNGRPYYPKRVRGPKKQINVEELSAEEIANTKLFWGKYKGKQFKNLPEDYLGWLSTLDGDQNKKQVKEIAQRAKIYLKIKQDSDLKVNRG